MADWLSMGGYGGFIWPAYGLSVAALVGLTIWSWRDYFSAKRRAQSFDHGLEK